MSSAGVSAPGLDRVTAGLRAAGADVGDLEATNLQVAQLVLAKARPRMPHRTGALVSSMRAVATPREATVTVGVPYARPVLFGAPRAGRRGAAVTPVTVVLATQADWMDLYTEHVTDAVEKIKGD